MNRRYTWFLVLCFGTAACGGSFACEAPSAPSLNGDAGVGASDASGGFDGAVAEHDAGARFDGGDSDIDGGLPDSGILPDAGCRTGRLQFIGPPASFAHGINDNGEALFSAIDFEGGRRQCFVWEESGVRAISGLSAYDFLACRAIGPGGEVVGEVQGQGTLAFILRKDGGLEFFGDDGSGGVQASTARAVNADGQVAGVSVHHGVVWSAGGETKLAQLVPTGAALPPRAMNDLGQVVGSAVHSSGLSRAVMWQPDGEVIDLGTLNPDERSVALDITNGGLIAGASGARPVLWSNGAIVDLGLSLAAGSAVAYSVNESGWAVGHEGLSFRPRALLWRGGGSCILESLIDADAGLQLHEAFGINSVGQVIGEAEIEGQRRVFVLLLDAAD